MRNLEFFDYIKGKNPELLEKGGRDIDSGVGEEGE
jgi:hypothetical protein